MMDTESEAEHNTKDEAQEMHKSAKEEKEYKDEAKEKKEEEEEEKEHEKAKVKCGKRSVYANLCEHFGKCQYSELPVLPM